MKVLERTSSKQRGSSLQSDGYLSNGRLLTLRLAEWKGYDWPAMSEVNLYPRYAESRLLEALADSPCWA